MKTISKKMNDIYEFYCIDNEIYLQGKDERGNEFKICFESFNFLEIISIKELKHIKEKLNKYIKTL